LFAVIVIQFIFPQSVFESIWLGHPKSLVIYAFIAVFLQQQIWNTFTQIGEAAKLSHRVQILNLVVPILHLSLPGCSFLTGQISVQLVFGFIILEYALMSVVAGFTLPLGQKGVVPFQASVVAREYYVFSAPLALNASLGFLYAFADNWLLQRFGGAIQQGFYSVSSQLASVSVIASTAMTNVAWQEIAAAFEKKDLERVNRLYQKAIRLFFFVGAGVSCFLIPWSKELTVIALGPSYLESAPVLAIMFFYPITQTLGFLAGTLFLAAGKTKEYFYYTFWFLLLSLPVGYLSQAPATAAVPGLGLGAIGLALKMVLFNFVAMNALMAWARRCISVPYEWKFQFGTLGVLLGLGFAVTELSRLLFDFYPVGTTLTLRSALIPFGFAGIVYLLLGGAVLCFYPALAGLSKAEIDSLKEGLKF